MAIEEGDEPESLLLDISNLEHLWGSEAELVEQVEKFFTRRGYRVRLAVADTVGPGLGAGALSETGKIRARARCRDRRMSRSSPIRQSASPPSPFLTSRSNPCASPTTPPRCSASWASKPSVSFMALPREELASRFGDELLRRLDQLTGAAGEVIVPHRGLAALEASYSLEEPTADRAVLMHVLDATCRAMARQLAARDQGAVLLMCLLAMHGRPTRCRCGSACCSPRPARGN